MLGPPDLTNQTSNFLFENVNKMLSTFVPAHHRRQSNQLFMSIGVKSHGTITFADNKSNKAEFIRIPQDASVMHVKELLNRQWCKERPSLVISVTGGAKDYNMKPKLMRAFRRGLLKVARTTGAWIITGGMNTGIMKLVGEIIQINPNRSRPIHLIGIGTWGCVAGVDQLDVHGTNVNYAKIRSEQKGEAPLEPNHTEFIFVDNGSMRKYGGEIAFRAQLEQAISGDFFAPRAVGSSSSINPGLTGTQALCPEQSDPVPVVLLVVEGGPNTVRTVHEAVVQNNIPAVFLEGTGRCCDLFAKAYYLYHEYRKKLELTEDTSHMDSDIVLARYAELKNKLREGLKVELREISGEGDGAGGPRKSVKNVQDASEKKPPKAATAEKRPPKVDTTDYFELVYECIHTRASFLNVISLNSLSSVEPDIDLAILQALLKATVGSDSNKTSNQRKREQFHLALEWKRVDIARNYIMKDVRNWDDIDLNDMFELALTRDQTDFVKLFLDHDFSLTNVFRNHEKLLYLYLSAKNERNNSLAAPAHPLRTIYRDIIQPKIGDFFEVEAALNPQHFSVIDNADDDDDKEACWCCLGTRSDRNYRNNSTANRTESVLSTADLDAPMDVDKELFLWSVIRRRRDFNLLFWARGKNKICSALIATLVYRKRGRKTDDSSCLQAADEFEHLAVQILNKFYQANARACTKAVIRQIPAYGNVTWLELAITADAKQFIAQPVVQEVLNNIWYGYIDQNVQPMWIIFSTIMLWYSGALYYNDELVKTQDQAPFEERSEKPSFNQRNLRRRKSVHAIERPKNETRMKLMRDYSKDEENAPVNFVDVGCFEKTRTRVIRYFGNIVKFMRAPCVKYLYSLYFHMLFLLLFSYMILCDFFPLYDFDPESCAPVSTRDRNKLPDHQEAGASEASNIIKPVPYGLQKRNQPAITEYVLAVWIFTLLCEEVRQFFSLEAKSTRNAIVAYFEVFWNVLDVVAIILFYIGFGLRFAPVAECFCAARIILSIDLTIWFMRSLDIFAAVKQLGPKLVMISEMAYDLKFYMLMLTVFILGFGVSSYSLMYGTKEFSWHLPRDIVNIAYWHIFGELNELETIENNYSANGYTVFILLVIYMVLVSILLVNLLIAMFSNTFDRLQSDTDRIYKFQRYSLITEYLSRPSLPPPFIFISHMWRLTLYILSRLIKSPWLQSKYAQHTNRTKYKITLDEKLASIIETAEDALGDEVYYNYMKTANKLDEVNELDEERIQSPQETMLNKIRTLENRMQLMTNQQVQVFDYLECLLDGLRMLGGDRIRLPERRRFDPDEPFDDGINYVDHSKSPPKREYSVDDSRRHGSATSDEINSSAINLFPNRKNV